MAENRVSWFLHCVLRLLQFARLAPADILFCLLRVRIFFPFESKAKQATLACRDAMRSQRLRRNGTDKKWEELSALLQNHAEMFDGRARGIGGS